MRNIYYPIKYGPKLQQMFSIAIDTDVVTSQSGNWLVVFAENALFNKDSDDLEEAEYEHPDTAEDQEAAVRREKPRNLDIFDWTGGRTVLLRVVGEEWQVGAVELEEVSEKDETVCRDQGSHSEQKEKQNRVHFVKCLELPPCLL